jgi:hypothetical protein
MAESKILVQYEEIINVLRLLEPDLDKFVRGNKIAGTRVRHGLQSVQKMAQDLRIEIQEMKKKLDPKQVLLKNKKSIRIEYSELILYVLAGVYYCLKVARFLALKVQWSW